MAEAASALATELLRCEGRKKTKGRRWAGPARWGSWAGWWAARVRPGRPGKFLFFLFNFVLFFFFI